MGMKNVAVIFHSVYGNTLAMAKYYERAFLDEGFAVGIFRVQDYFNEEESSKNRTLHNVGEQLASIPVIKDIGLLEGYHAVALGCPVRFCDVSAAMKAFIDTFFYVKEPTFLFGKYFLSFASAETHAGGGVETLLALNKFGMQMGMFPVPLPPKTQFMPPFGCLHFSGPYMSSPPDQTVLMGIRSHVYAAACAMTDDAELYSMIDNIEDFKL